MFKVLLISLLAFNCSSTKINQQDEIEFEGYQLADDLNQLVLELKENHPGLYWYQDSLVFENRIDQVKKELKRGQSLLAFYNNVNQLVSSIGCGHTRLKLPKKRKQLFLDFIKYLPFNILIRNNQLIVLHEYNKMPKGSIIQAINGINALNIIQKLRMIIPSDGYNITGKDYYISKKFSELYAMNIGNNNASLEMKYSESGIETIKSIKVELVAFKKIVPTNSNNDLLMLTELNESTKLLSIRTFSSSYLESNGFKYYNFLKNSFSNINNTKTKNLIIDVRGNGGGDDNFGATLVSYLTNERFKYFEYIEVTENYDGWGKIEMTGNEKHLMTSHEGLSEYQPNLNRFQGNTYILIDGGSFSTTADFVSVTKNIKAARIIGEETGGGAYGNTSGPSKKVTLRNSRISVNIPLWKYQTALEKFDNMDHGVYPEYNLTNNPNTIKDEVMEFTLDLIESN